MFVVTELNDAVARDIAALTVESFRRPPMKADWKFEDTLEYLLKNEQNPGFTCAVEYDSGILQGYAWGFDLKDSVSEWSPLEKLRGYVPEERTVFGGSIGVRKPDEGLGMRLVRELTPTADFVAYRTREDNHAMLNIFEKLYGMPIIAFKSDEQFKLGRVFVHAVR